MNFKNYLNRITGNNNIYSRSGMMGMTLKELLEREKELVYQYRNIGIPEDEELELSPDVEKRTDSNGNQGWFSRLAQASEFQPTGFAVNMQKGQGIDASTLLKGSVGKSQISFDNLKRGTEDYVNNIKANLANYNQPDHTMSARLSDVTKSVGNNVQNLINPVKEITKNFQSKIRNIVDLTIAQKDKILNNTTDYSQPITLREQILNNLIMGIPGRQFPMASDMYIDSMHNMGQADINSHAKVLDNMQIIDNEKVKSVLKRYGVNDDERGVIYDEQSDFAKKIINSKELKEIIEKRRKNSEANSIDEERITFPAALFDVVFNKDKFDRNVAIQNAVLVEPYFDEEGYFHGKLVDRYDFKHEEAKNLKEFPKIYINNHGYNMQKKGNLENYFSVIELNSKYQTKNKKKQ